MKDSILLGW